MSNWFRWRRQGEHEDAPLDSIRYVVLDTELTSLDKRSNRLLSVGAVAMDGSKILLGEQFYREVNPGVAPPAPGVVIHGLRPNDVERCEPPAQILEELKTFLHGGVLVGHFFDIDRSILRKEFTGNALSLTPDAIDTAKVEQWILRRSPYSAEEQARRLEHLDLESLAVAYGLPFQEAHHALEDAFLTARLWQRQIHALRERGVHTLGEALRAGGI